MNDQESLFSKESCGKKKRDKNKKFYMSTKSAY